MSDWIGVRGRAGIIAGMVAVIVAIFSVAWPGATRAQGAPSITSTSMQNDFPTSVTFSAVVENAGTLEEAIFFYTVLPEGARTRATAQITPGDVTRIRATFPTNTATTYIPAGSQIRWFWQLTTADGETVETEPELWAYEDPRYEWQVIREGDLELYYYENEAIARDLLAQGAEAIDEMSALLGIELGRPARLYMWANPGDAGGVERVESATFEETVLTGGTRVLADLVLIFQPTRWVVRHELTHILTKIAGEGGIGQLPAWLDEGTATYAEGDWRARRGSALDFAIENDLLLTVRSMGSNTNIPGQVDIFYAQSAALVTYLINTYGQEQFAELYAVFKRGSSVDNALQEVYGIDRDQLTNDYRESVSLPPVEAGEDRSRVFEDDAVPATGSRGGETEAEEGGAEASAQAAPARSDDEIAARRAAIEERLAERRAAPVFSRGGDFPWEGVVTGLAGATLLGAMVLLWRILSTPRSPAPPAEPWHGWRPRH